METINLPDNYLIEIGADKEKVVRLNCRLLHSVDTYKHTIPGGRTNRYLGLKVHNLLKELDAIGQPFSFTLYILGVFRLSLTMEEVGLISHAYDLG
jgi:hypothetical protein